MSRSFAALVQRSFVLLLVVALIGGCQQGQKCPRSAAAAPRLGQAKYVFLFIGDGMGMTQRMAAETYLGGPALPEEALVVPRLTMNSLPVVGLSRTNSWNAHVTDSAAAATAMATGQKTINGYLSVDPVDKKPLKTFAEIAIEHGWRVGLVSSSPIDDATPGAFYAHESSRGNKYEVAMAAATSGVYFLGGAGPVGARAEAIEGRQSPLEVARANGFRLVHSRDELMAVRPGSGRVWCFRMGQEERPLGMSFDVERHPQEPSLAEYTRKAIELLDNEKGFFLMVEGGLTDYAGHGNCLASAVHEVLALDAAVEEALQFYALHPDETLIIVTGDHETGGLSSGSIRSNHDLLRERVDAQKGSLSAMVKAIGDWRQAKTPFEEALPQIQEMMGWPELAEHEVADLRAAYAESAKGLPYKQRAPEVQRKYGTLDPLQTTIYNKMADQSGFTWTTGGHTGQPIMTTAVGAGAWQFGGYFENTEVFRFMLRAAGMPIPQRAAVPSRLRPKEETPSTTTEKPAEIKPVPAMSAQ